MSDNVPAIIPFDTLERMAASIAKSGLFGVKNIDQAISLMMIAQAEGMHPAAAANEFDIINGKAARKTHAVLARFQAAGGTVAWKDLTDTKVTGVFTHKQGGTVEVTWDIPRATRAELAGKDMWKKYPRQMLRARCIAEGIRLVYPAALNGMLVAEEAMDLPPAEKDMGKVEQIDPWTDELKAAANTESLKGIKAYGEWWKAQDSDWRDIAVNTQYHADMKAQALKPEAERNPPQEGSAPPAAADDVVDAEFTEKPDHSGNKVVDDWVAQYDGTQSKEVAQ